MKALSKYSPVMLHLSPATRILSENLKMAKEWIVNYIICYDFNKRKKKYIMKWKLAHFLDGICLSFALSQSAMLLTSYWWSCWFARVEYQRHWCYYCYCLAFFLLSYMYLLPANICMSIKVMCVHSTREHCLYKELLRDWKNVLL